MSDIEVLLFRQSSEYLAVEVCAPLSAGSSTDQLSIGLRRFGFTTNFLGTTGWQENPCRIAVANWQQTSIGLVLLIPSSVARSIQEDMLLEVSLFNQQGDVLACSKIIAPALDEDGVGAADAAPETDDTDLPMRMAPPSPPQPAAPLSFSDIVPANAYEAPPAPLPEPVTFIPDKPSIFDIQQLKQTVLRHRTAAIAAAAVVAVGLLGFFIVHDSEAGASAWSTLGFGERRIKTREEVGKYLGENPPLESAVKTADAAAAAGSVDSAFLVYRYAAEKGDVVSALRLARMYNPDTATPQTESFIKPNVDGAAVWYKIGVDANNADAKFELGRMMLHATDNPDTDRAAALALIQAAASGGHEGAREFLKTVPQ